MDPREKDIFRLEKNELYFKNFTIIQLSDIQTDTGSVCPIHIQTCNEISYVVSGFCQHIVNGRQMNLVPGDILLLREGDVHFFTTDLEQPVRIFNIGIRRTPTADEEFIGIWNELYSYPTPLVLHEATKVEKQFVQIFEEIVGNKFGWKYAVRVHIEQILLTVCRAMKKIYTPVYQPQSKEEIQKHLLYSMINYIDTHQGEIDTLKDMCSVFHYSYTYLSHFFKDMTGIPLSAYYQQRRFGYAVDLLKEERYSVTEIAQRLGYQTVHAFSKAFRKYYGMSPTQYMKVKHRTEEEHVV